MSIVALPLRARERNIPAIAQRAPFIFLFWVLLYKFPPFCSPKN